MPNTEEQKERKSVTLVYLGVGRTSKGKKGHRWHEIKSVEVNDGGKLSQESSPHLYEGKNLLAGASPGAIISIEMDAEGTTCYPGTARLVGNWNNEEDVLLWRSVSRATAGDLEREQKAAKEMRRDLPGETLEPFRHAYWLCRNSRQRSQLLAWVIDQITSPDMLTAQEFIKRNTR